MPSDWTERPILAPATSLGWAIDFEYQSQSACKMNVTHQNLLSSSIIRHSTEQIIR